VPDSFAVTLAWR